MGLTVRILMFLCAFGVHAYGSVLLPEEILQWKKVAIITSHPEHGLTRTYPTLDHFTSTTMAKEEQLYTYDVVVLEDPAQDEGEFRLPLLQAKSLLKGTDSLLVVGYTKCMEEQLKPPECYRFLGVKPEETMPTAGVAGDGEPPQKDMGHTLDVQNMRYDALVRCAQDSGLAVKERDVLYEDYIVGMGSLKRQTTYFLLYMPDAVPAPKVRKLSIK